MGEDVRVDLLCSKILSGNATQRDRDELAVYTAKSLWELKDLDEHIEEVSRRVLSRRGLGDRLPWFIVAVLVMIIAVLVGVDITPLIH